MSKEEVDRFVADLATNPETLTAVKDRTSGLDSIVALTRVYGYNVTLDEAKVYLQMQGSLIEMDELMRRVGALENAA